MPDEVYEPLQARYDEETLVLIVTTAVLTLANNYWNNIVGTPIDDYLHDGHYVERELDIQKAAAEQKIIIGDKNSRQGGGYFCILLLSVPNVYPAQKQVSPKLTTAMKSKILIG